MAISSGIFSTEGNDVGFRRRGVACIYIYVSMYACVYMCMYIGTCYIVVSTGKNYCLSLSLSLAS